MFFKELFFPSLLLFSRIEQGPENSCDSSVENTTKTALFCSEWGREDSVFNMLLECLLQTDSDQITAICSSTESSSRS